MAGHNFPRCSLIVTLPPGRSIVTFVAFICIHFIHSHFIHSFIHSFAYSHLFAFERCTTRRIEQRGGPQTRMEDTVRYSNHAYIMPLRNRSTTHTAPALPPPPSPCPQPGVSAPHRPRARGGHRPLHGLRVESYGRPLAIGGSGIHAGGAIVAVRSDFNSISHSLEPNRTSSTDKIIISLATLPPSYVLYHEPKSDDYIFSAHALLHITHIIPSPILVRKLGAPADICSKTRHLHPPTLPFPPSRFYHWFAQSDRWQICSHKLYTPESVELRP